MNGTATQAKRLGSYRSVLGECPVWDSRAASLRWVDIPEHRLLVTDPRSGETQAHILHRQVNAIVPSDTDAWIATSGPAICELRTSGEMSVLTEIADANQRFNDAHCDALGRLWAGTATDGPEPISAIYRVDGTVCDRLIPGIVMGNGIGWSPDNSTLYCVDSVARRLYALDFDLERGAVSNQRTHIELPEGQLPDGLAVDLQGNIWLAVWEGSCVLCISPSGEVLSRISVPTPRVTSCCFGGRDYGTLFITTARADAGSFDDGIGGALFAATTGTRGSTPNIYIHGGTADEH